MDLCLNIDSIGQATRGSVQNI